MRLDGMLWPSEYSAKENMAETNILEASGMASADQHSAAKIAVK